MVAGKKAVAKEPTIGEVFRAVKSLAEHVKRLDGRLTKHMEDEEQETHEIRDKLTAITDLMTAMPFKDGEPDLHGHRVDHENLRETKEHASKLIWGIRGEFIKLAIIAIVVMLSSGNFTKILELMK